MGQPIGSHAAVAAEGQRSWRPSCRIGWAGSAPRGPAALRGAAGRRVVRLGTLVRRSARRALDGGGPVDAIGYAGAGSLALLDDDGLDALLSPIPGEVVANNRFSADAFVVGRRP